MEEQEIDRYNHVMYASKSHINQFFMENVSESDRIVVSESESSGSTFEIGVDWFAKLNSEFSDEIGTEEIHEINFNDSFLQVKKAINMLSTSDGVYPISALKEAEPSPTGLYHFDCPLQLLPNDDAFDDRTYVEVIGLQDDVEFRGTTSWDNWGSRSHALTAMRTVDPYPFKGVVKPLQIDEKGLETVTYSVQYLYILAPDVDKNKEWREYQQLLDLHPGQSDSQEADL